MSSRPAQRIQDWRTASEPPKNLPETIEALLKRPGAIADHLRADPRITRRLMMCAALALLVSGIASATFSGGAQLFLVPIKVTLGAFFCAVLCMPSLHVLSSLFGARVELRETWGALWMGISLMAILMVSFAPIAWVFGQATSSIHVMGTIQGVLLILSTFIGLRVTRAAMERAGGSAASVRLWGLLFVVVLLQMSTSLRPLVGPYEGELLSGKLFFIEHWAS